MKIGTYNQLRLICVLGLTASLTLTGCKAGIWKMPKMSWSREPSATTLAGTETPKLPESPANKYTPSTIASVGAGTSPGTSSGNKAPSNGYAGQTSSATTPASAGLAASANGFHTGSYSLGQKTNTLGSQPGGSSSPSAVAAGPNPYGGSYAGMNPAKPADTTVQNGVKGALANYPAPNASTGYGAAPQATGSAYAGTTPVLPQIPNTPAPGTFGSTAPSNPYSNLPPLPSIGGVPNASAVAAQNPVVNVPSYPGTSLPTHPNQGQPSVGGQTSVGTYTANQSATSQPSNRYSGVYQPGTTSRSTTYNFGSVAPAAATTPSATGTTLPPNTASNPPPGVIR